MRRVHPVGLLALAACILGALNMWHQRSGIHEKFSIMDPKIQEDLKKLGEIQQHLEAKKEQSAAMKAFEEDSAAAKALEAVEKAAAVIEKAAEQAKEDEANRRAKRVPRYLPMTPDVDTTNEYRTTIVMPCTVSDLWTLPMSLESISQSSDPAHEVMIVYSFEKDFEHALNEMWTPGVTDELDRARDLFRNWFVRHLKYLPDTMDIVGESIKINEEKGLTEKDKVDIMAAWAASGLDVNIKPTYEKLEHEYPEAMKEYLKTAPSIHSLMDDIPNISIIVNQDAKPFANASRFRGAMEAFGGKAYHPHMTPGDIISYIDCDDRVLPARVRVIQEVFREVPEAQEVLGGFVRYIFGRKHKKDGFTGGRGASESVDVPVYEKHFAPLVKTMPPEKWTAEYFEEEVASKYFLHRDPVLRDKVFKKQETDNFHSIEYKDQLGVEGQALHKITNPRDLLDPNLWNNNKHQLGPNDAKAVAFGWWYGKREELVFDEGLPKDDVKPWNTRFFSLHGGASSFRLPWIVNTLQAFPNTRYGQDSRLTLMTSLYGGKIAPISIPLMEYIKPGGGVKRHFMQSGMKDQQKKKRVRDREEKVAEDMKHIRPKETVIAAAPAAAAPQAADAVPETQNPR